MFMIGSMVHQCIGAVHVYDRVYGTSVYRSSTCMYQRSKYVSDVEMSGAMSLPRSCAIGRLWWWEK